MSTNRAHVLLSHAFALVAAWSFVAGESSSPARRPSRESSRAFIVPVPGGTITESTTWSAHRTYRLTGSVHVGAGAVLTIEAGTRVEGVPGAELVVDRNGRVDAIGTMLQPIVLACPAGTIATRDCWGGLIIAGNAPVNGGTPDSPPVRGTGAGGCAQRADEPSVGQYGGCQINDNSGVLRYVRVEHSARGLQLLGVGSGTQIEFVQVHAAGTGGITIRGGAVDLRHAIVTSSGPTGVRWSGGWVGRAQHLLVQTPAEGGVGIEGLNDAATPSATPRSAPELYNVSVIRLDAAPGAPTTTGVRIADGSAAHLQNVLVAGFDVSLDIDGAESCGLVGSALVIRHGIVASTGALGDPDTDAPCAAGSTIEDQLLGDVSLDRITDAQLIGTLMKSAYSATLPDFRALSPSFISRGTTPPANGFYLPSVYVGAVETATLTGANIPWHGGWTRDALVAPLSLTGAIAGVVSSPARGALNGARVEAGGASTLTAADGSFSLAGITAGSSAVSVTTTPAGCTLPAPVAATVLAGATSSVNVAITCTTPTIVASTLRLTYMCGQRFRVRNPNDAVVTVTWDVAGVGENGTLSLPARPLTGSFSETFFSTVATGTVRLFYNGVQADVKANGGFACAP